MSTVLITGASGFLGSYVIAALQGRGHGVRIAARTSLPNPRYPTVIVGNIGRHTDWHQTLQGIDAVVHLAGRAHRPPAIQNAERDLYFETNTEGTLCLARQSAAAGVRKFVFLSSIAVNGATTDNRAPFREDDPSAPETVYGLSKAVAEEGLIALARDKTMSVNIIRPPLIYGRGSKGSFAMLLRAIRSNIPLPFASIANRRAFVAAENISDFIGYALDAEMGHLNIHIVADHEQVSTSVFIQLMAQAAGKKALLFPAPISAMKALTHLCGRPDLFNSLYGSLEIDPAKVQATRWRPPFSLSEGLTLATAR